jgi:type II secretory pathway pseudopilin PulG
MRSRSRPAFTRIELIVCLTMAGVFLALVLAAVAHFRYEARVTESKQKLKTITLALIEYADQHPHRLFQRGSLPPGLDDHGFSALSKILPQIGEGELYRRIDFTKSIDDPANRPARQTTVAAFLSPLDDPPARDDSTKGFGPTNYLVNALAFPNEYGTIYPEGFFNDKGAQTVFVVETLRGGPSERRDVRREHVALGRSGAATDRVRWGRGDEFRGGWFAEDQARWDKVGVQEFAAGRHLANDRGSSWMDGSPLQSLLLPGRRLNDPLPDAIIGNPGRMEGVSGPRSLTHLINVSMGDGSVRSFDDRITSDEVWFNALSPAAKEGTSWDW